MEGIEKIMSNSSNNESDTSSLFLFFKILRSSAGILYFIYAVSDYKFRNGIQRKLVELVN